MTRPITPGGSGFSSSEAFQICVAAVAFLTVVEGVKRLASKCESAITAHTPPIITSLQEKGLTIRNISLAAAAIAILSQSE